MSLLKDPRYAPWAVGNYGVGTDAWSSQPRRFPLSDADRAAGFTPNTPAAVEAINTKFAELTDSDQLQLFRAADTWQEYSPALSTDDCVANAICGFSWKTVSSIRSWGNRVIAASGSRNVSGNPHAFFSVSQLGSTPWQKQADDGSTLGATIDVCSNDGQVGSLLAMYQGEYRLLTSSFANGVNSGVITPRGASPGPLIQNIFGAFGKWWIFWDDQMLQHATAVLGSWTNATPAALAGMAFADAANDGVNTVVMIGRNSIANCAAVYSTDQGVTWALGHNFGDLNGNVVWSAARGMFVAWLSDGSIWTSANGSAWFQQTNSGFIKPSNGALLGRQTFAACGNVIAKLFQLDVGTTPVGVAWSYDLGLTWFVRPVSNIGPFGGGGGTEYPGYQLKSIMGRLWMTDGTFVYRSGRLEADTTADFA